ncbi:Crp/Fnr family transcriptional regulator [Enterococcus hirae]|jgi:CRP-like cAMP-binding protein|nr:Crp/Fnr family transcriptional regulator [Enterococcaceae bacterium]MCI1920156.1 Crp/Fnr family transcriptional regulator [Enterococcaceae bacterium]MDM8212577.1 Crp/Fnr family transcriptional regulator [Enterococcus hirae]
MLKSGELPVVQQSKLFKNVTKTEIAELLAHLAAETVAFQEGERIWQAGETAAQIGLVLSGHVQIIKEDFHGNRMILTKVASSGIFGEAYAYAAPDTLPVSVDMAESGRILFLQPEKMLAASAWPGGGQLLRNILQILAQKSLMLNQKIEILSQRKVEDKVLAFLIFQSRAQKSRTLLIPYDRQEMADALGVERSALSAVLSKMKKAGKIDFHKNRFELLSD